MSKYLLIQFGLVAAGVFFAALAGQVSGVAWALCAGVWIWLEKRARDRADLAEDIIHATRTGLAKIGVYVTVEEHEPKE